MLLKNEIKIGVLEQRVQQLEKEVKELKELLSMITSENKFEKG